MKFNHFIILSLTCSLVACANNPKDPYEPYNRAMFKVNDALDTAVITPTARGYQKVVPKPVRHGVTNVFDNFKDVISLGSNVLRLDVEKASTDFIRIGFNTVFGLGGLLPMADMAKMPNNKNTLGDTFASWGWKNSNYLVMPLAGPSTVRDSLGTAVTTVYSPQNALINSDKVLIGVSALNVIDTRVKYLGLTDILEETSLDKYAETRDLYMARRAEQVGGTYASTNEEDVFYDDDSNENENETNLSIENNSTENNAINNNATENITAESNPTNQEHVIENTENLEVASDIVVNE